MIPKENPALQLSEKDVFIAVPSIVVAVGILSLPANLAEKTVSSDGWITLVISGLVMIFITWMMAKLASRYPNQSFLTYASKLVTRPIAIFLSLLFAIQGFFVASFEIRAIADISQVYLLNDTPTEVLSLSFFLVVVYAVSSSRSGIFRLNMLFFPLILFISLFVILLSMGWFEKENLLPVFKTDINGYVKGITSSIGYYGHISILLFYISFAKQPKKAPKMAALGMGFTVFLYTLLFIVSVGVMGNGATSNLIYPTIELAKELEIPGGFFERFESVFFTVWVMAIFTTTALALDVVVMILQSIFKNMKKITIIFSLAPFVYLTGLIPIDNVELFSFEKYNSYYGLILISFVTLLLTIMSKVKGAK